MFNPASRATWSVVLAFGLVVGVPCVRAQDRPARPIEAPGKLVPAQVAWIYPPTDGVVHQIRCKDGEKVRKGQLLLEIDNFELQKQQTTLRMEVDLARRRAEVALAGLKEKPLPEQERRKLEEEVLVQRSQSDIKAKELAALERQLDALMIKAPADGTVLLANADHLQGKPVHRDAPLLRVARLDGDWHVVAHVNESDVGRLLTQVKQAEGKPVDVELEVAAFPGRTFHGTLHRDDVPAAMTTHEDKPVLTIQVRVAAASLKELRELPVGVNARVRIPLAK